MKRVFIFAIGGTGARVLRSLSMLLAAGIKGMNDLELIPIIIDYDVINGDKSIANACLEKYCQLQDQITAGNEDDSFFMTKVCRLKDVAAPGGSNWNKIQSNDFDLYFGPATTDCTFSDEIQYDLLTKNMDRTHSLLEALYDDSPAKDANQNENKNAELNLNLKKGFLGNPNIGSVVFDRLKATEEFKHFSSVFDPVTDKIFIISSIFGGTGSSGFPQVVNSIRNSPMPSLRNAVIGAVVVLPYFKIKNEGGAIDSNNFNSKTKAALSYYESSGLNKRLDSIYYIGDTITSQLADHDGGGEQKNIAHIVELLSALSIVDFCTKDYQGNNAFEYGITSNKDSLSLANFDEIASIHPHFDYLTRFAYMAKYYRDILQEKRGHIGSQEAFYNGLNIKSNIQSKQQNFKNFEEFLFLFEQWIDELGRNAHKFVPYMLGEQYKFTRMLSHKPLRENRVFPDQLTDSDFTKYLNDAYKTERTVVISAEDEFKILLKIMRKASKKILEKVNSISN